MKTRQPKSTGDDAEEDFICMHSSVAPTVSKSEVLQALNTLRRYLRQNCSEYDFFFKIEKKIHESVLTQPVQKKIFSRGSRPMIYRFLTCDEITLHAFNTCNSKSALK